MNEQTYSFDEDDDRAQEPKKRHGNDEETGLDDFIYQNVDDDKMDDLGAYLQWHRDHPNCSTPRVPRRGFESMIAAGTYIRCDEDSEYAGKVYTTYATKSDKDLPEEFGRKLIGWCLLILCLIPPQRVYSA